MPDPTAREASLMEQLRVALEHNAVLQQENKLLKEKVDLLVRRLFGAKSEKLSPEQLTLLLEGEQGSKKEPAPGASCGALEAELDKAAHSKPSSPKHRRPRVPQDLPLVQEIIIPEEVKACPQQWRQTGQEVTEQIDYQPAKFLRRQLIRLKYVKLSARHSPPIIAPLNTLQEGCIAGVGLLAHIAVSKFCDHLPLYRQEQIFATRYGMDIPRQSMARWMGLVADWLRPIYEQIRISIFDKGHLQIDETPIKYLCPGNGQTKLGYLWVCKTPAGDVWYSWQLGRGAQCLERIVPQEFRGTIQCDGYASYATFAKARGERIELAGCMAHARRNFVEAKELQCQHACWILLQIQHLYRIETRLREQRAGPALRAAVRQSEAVPIMERIYKVLSNFKRRGCHLPKSTMGDAIDYALKQWSKLCLYLQDGRLEIDNNEVENAIRCTAIGKKNWLFIGEAQAGERAAIIYTVIESCRRRGLDPYTYLCDVLSRLPEMTNQQIHEVTPAAWAKAHPAAQRLAA